MTENHGGTIRSTTVFLLAALVASGGARGAEDSDAARAKKNAERLLQLHLEDATEFEIYRDSDHRQKVELRRQPIYLWTNPTRDLGQTGAVFVWTYQGRPEIVASIFSHPEAGRRVVVHELHSLATSLIEPLRRSDSSWRPKEGLARKPIPNAPLPADSVRQRKLQFSALTRDFSAYSIDYDEHRWDLRILAKELLRYASPEQGVIDGALCAFVTTAGTDPEVMLIIEALQTDDGPRWHYAVARFSDLNLFVEHKKVEVWRSVRDKDNTLNFNLPRTYRLYRDRIIDEIIEEGK